MGSITRGTARPTSTRFGRFHELLFEITYLRATEAPIPIRIMITDIQNFGMILQNKGVEGVNRGSCREIRAPQNCQFGSKLLKNKASINCGLRRNKIKQTLCRAQ